MIVIEYRIFPNLIDSAIWNISDSSVSSTDLKSCVFIQIIETINYNVSIVEEVLHFDQTKYISNFIFIFFYVSISFNDEKKEIVDIILDFDRKSYTSILSVRKLESEAVNEKLKSIFSPIEVFHGNSSQIGRLLESDYRLEKFNNDNFLLVKREKSCEEPTKLLIEQKYNSTMIKFHNIFDYIAGCPLTPTTQNIFQIKIKIGMIICLTVFIILIIFLVFFCLKKCKNKEKISQETNSNLTESTFNISTFESID